MMAAMVARDPGAIGYGGIAYAPGAHLLKLIPKGLDQAVAPSAQAVRYGEYPLGRPLQYYLNPSTVSPQVKSFLRWVLGREGQEIVRTVGYFPVLPPDPTPKPRGNIIPVTPDNMREHGLRVTARFGQDDSTDLFQFSKDKVHTSVHFHPEGPTIREVTSLALKLGDDLTVPLTPERDPITGLITEVEFTVRIPVLSDILIELTVPAAEGAPQIYQLLIRYWNRAETS
jgi:hypothetical protein